MHKLSQAHDDQPQWLFTTHPQSPFSLSQACEAVNKTTRSHPFTRLCYPGENKCSVLTYALTFCPAFSHRHFFALPSTQMSLSLWFSQLQFHSTTVSELRGIFFIKPLEQHPVIQPVSFYIWYIQKYLLLLHL